MAILCMFAGCLLVSHTTFKLYQFTRQLSVEFCCRYAALLTVQCFRHELIHILSDECPPDREKRRSYAIIDLVLKHCIFSQIVLPVV